MDVDMQAEPGLDNPRLEVRLQNCRSLSPDDHLFLLFSAGALLSSIKPTMETTRMSGAE